MELWRRLRAKELMLLNCGIGEDSWESLGLQGDPTSPFWRRSTLGFLWKEWCWGWNSSTLDTSCEALTHWKRPWCWKGLGAGGEGDDGGWDGWMYHWLYGHESEWTPGVGDGQGGLTCCDSWGCKVGHDWATELNWTEQCRRPGFDLWVRKILWRREWQSTPVFLPREFHGQRSLAGYSTRGCKESDTTERLTHTHTHQNSWTTIVVKITVLRIRVYEGEAGDSWI